MGNKTSVNQRKLNEEYRKMVHTYWLFCPRCFHISSVNPFIFDDELYISLYCRCIFDERQFIPFEELLKIIMGKKAIGNTCKKHKYSPGYLFCIFCQKWLCDYCFLSHKETFPSHLLNHIPIILRESCNKHEKEIAVGYCKTCDKNICEICLREQIKLRHDIFFLNHRNNKILCDKKWEEFLDKQRLYSIKNLEFKIEMINEINNDKNLKEEEKKNLIQKLNINYAKNKKINNKLCEYILFLFSNFDYTFKVLRLANYNICNNVFKLKFNKTFFNNKEQISTLAKVEKLIEYYNDIHLLGIQPLQCSKNISSERRNVTNQIAKIFLLDDNTAATLISKGIVIVWNIITYEELYRIKKLTINEKINNDNIINNDNNANNNINDNIQNYFIGFDEENEEDINNINNNNLIQQQFDIINQIQGNNLNNHLINFNVETKKVTLLKVYHETKFNMSNTLTDINSELINQGELSRINTGMLIEEEKEDEGLDTNLNFTSMAYIKKYNILALIIESYNDIYLFNVKTKEAFPERLIGHKKEVLEIVALKNSNLASYGNDFTLRIWNMNHFQNVTTINVQIKKFCIYFTQLLYGNIIFALDKSTVKIIKLPEYEAQPDIKLSYVPINFFELPDKRLLIASYNNIFVYDPPNYTQQSMSWKSRQKIYSFLLLDMNRLLIGIEENGVQTLNILHWKSKGGKISRKLIGELGFKSPIGSMVKTKNRRVIAVSWDNLIKVFVVRN